MDDVWKQTSVLTNAFAAISRISSFASTFVWAHGILASSIHITSVIVSCAFVNFWKKSRRFIHSHVLLLIDDLATCLFSKMIFSTWIHEQSGISLNLRTGQAGHATLFNQWEGALVFINKQIKTSPQWSKIFKTTDGVGGQN